ncbi:hypothetical protein EYF80_037543 [Liparis tanakae]|uniref:Uncharacterized protein n=1 Tax=Liparis tanakae TaxID=230148 RepID=A0A4Z2GFH1_9TELE|nr:hypothetical protein EYF80_037543 [Liparis tanakae]
MYTLACQLFLACGQRLCDRPQLWASSRVSYLQYSHRPNQTDGQNWSRGEFHLSVKNILVVDSVSPHLFPWKAECHRPVHLKQKLPL